MVEIKVHPFDTNSDEIEALKVGILRIQFNLNLAGCILWCQEEVVDDKARRNPAETIVWVHDGPQHKSQEKGWEQGRAQASGRGKIITFSFQLM